MVNNLTKTLLDWINVYIRSYYNLNSDNYLQYIGDPEQIFVDIHEWQIRKELLSAYLITPEEETIISFLENLTYVEQNSAMKKAVNKVLTRFNKPVL